LPIFLKGYKPAKTLRGKEPGAREQQRRVLALPLFLSLSDPERRGFHVDRAWSFNLSSLLFDNLRMRLNAAATMGRAGQWTAQQNEHVAETTLAGSEDPIAGTDQKSEDYQRKM
jgi:hypothetical protein